MTNALFTATAQHFQYPGFFSTVAENPVVNTYDLTTISFLKKTMAALLCVRVRVCLRLCVRERKHTIQA